MVRVDRQAKTLSIFKEWLRNVKEEIKLGIFLKMIIKKGISGRRYVSKHLNEAPVKYQEGA